MNEASPLRHFRSGVIVFCMTFASLVFTFFQNRHVIHAMQHATKFPGDPRVIKNSTHADLSLNDLT